MKTSQKGTKTGDDMNLLLSELRDLLMNNLKQLDQTGMKEKVDKILKWAKLADSGNDIAECRLEHQGLEMLKYVRDYLKLTGRRYTTFQNESPSSAPPQEPDPQTFFVTRDRVIEIIDTVLQLKIRNKGLSEF